MSPNSSIAPPIAGDSPALHHLSHVEAWIFDLDNTLYPASCNMFVQVEALIGRFIADFLTVDAVAARRLQKQSYRPHGTTLNGPLDPPRTDSPSLPHFPHLLTLHSSPPPPPPPAYPPSTPHRP